MDCTEYLTKNQTVAQPCGLVFYLVEGYKQLLCLSILARPNEPIHIEEVEFIKYAGCGLPVFRDHIEYLSYNPSVESMYIEIELTLP